MGFLIFLRRGCSLRRKEKGKKPRAKKGRSKKEKGLSRKRFQLSFKCNSSNDKRPTKRKTKEETARKVKKKEWRG